MKEKLKQAKVIAVLSVNEVEDAINLVSALKDGGVNALEMTLRSPNAFKCIEAVAQKFDDILLGVGTILTKEQLRQAKEVGASFGVSPGCNPAILDEAKKIDFAFAPGIMTPSDIEVSLEKGYNLMKFFPAQTSGGLKHLEAMSAPYRHLGVSFIPLGGININNYKEYLASDLIAAIGGSWLAPANLIKEKNWAKIRQNAEEISKA